MTNLLIGIGLGGFIYWGGGLFLKFAIKALKERKESEARKVEENLVKIVREIIKGE